MSDPLIIHSHKGPYQVIFHEDALADLNQNIPPKAHFVIDTKVATLYADQLRSVLSSPSVLCIEATEPNKSLDKFVGYVEHLIEKRIRRGDILIAIGGGIIQDITCFLGATLSRGMEWKFYPTTLLAQADSCIGSKSSINVGRAKNILGTFTPPKLVLISTKFLNTLSDLDLRSGIGEMLKAHVIDGPQSFNKIASDYQRLLSDRGVLIQYIRRSLELKKKIIEEDEFDQGIRNVMNYGHSFGHAIESATDFKVPHGIAVTLGMDMANYTSMRIGRMDRSHYLRMKPTLFANYAGFERLKIPLGDFMRAIAKDKKNTAEKLNLILPDATARVSRVPVINDAAFEEICSEFLGEERHLL